MVQATNDPSPAPPYTLEADPNPQSPDDRLPFAEAPASVHNPQNVPRFLPAENAYQAESSDQNAPQAQSQIPDVENSPGRVLTEAPIYGPQGTYQQQSNPYEMDHMRETLPSQCPLGNDNARNSYTTQMPRPLGSGANSLPAQSLKGHSPHFAPPPSHYQSHTSKKPTNLLSKFGAGSSKNRIEDVYIAVMGVTGAGKSSFISLCTKKSVVIGHNLMSCTMEVEDFSFMWNSHIRVLLIDTPGFDDTKRKDTDVLRDIAGWMAVTYTNKIKLSGIIYLHRITDPRMGGTQMRNLTMFKELCGPKCFPAVTLVTTFWGAIEPAIGADRERQLISNDEFWGYMAKKGSQVVRHSGTRNSAMDIVGAVVKRRAKIVLDIQDDMVNKGLDLDETLAGQSLNRELIEQRKKHQQEMMILEADMRKAIAEKDEESVEAIAQMQKEFQDKINQGNKDVQDLQASLENLKEERDREFKKIQEELAERAADYARREKEWQDYRDANSFDPEESERKEREMELLKQQLKDLIEKGERKRTGVWYEIGEFFEETVDEIKTWWKSL